MRRCLRIGRVVVGVLLGWCTRVAGTSRGLLAAVGVLGRGLLIVVLRVRVVLLLIIHFGLVFLILVKYLL